jgi:prepilin-type N-terminal cleavage/methylation domain-containing protein/prepilin-type processing-associated H-X9-DG protein
MGDVFPSDRRRVHFHRLHRPQLASRDGVTLVELLVVIAIISVLIALLLPAIQAARESARRSECVSHLHQLGLAVQNYHNVHATTPMGNDWSTSPIWGGWDYNAGIHLRLLPFLEENDLYDSIDHKLSLYTEPNLFVFAVSIAPLFCPSDAIDGPEVIPEGEMAPESDEPATIYCTNYVGNVGPRFYFGGSFDPTPPRAYYQGIFWDESRVRFSDITDGLSKTFLFSERARGLYTDDERPWNGWWPSGFPTDTLFATFHPINAARSVRVVASIYDGSRMVGGASSFHPGGANFCFADGSVRFLDESLDSWNLDDGELQQLWDSNTTVSQPRLYQWLSTRNGDEVATDSF